MMLKTFTYYLVIYDYGDLFSRVFQIELRLCSNGQMFKIVNAGSIYGSVQKKASWNNIKCTASINKLFKDALLVTPWLAQS